MRWFKQLFEVGQSYKSEIKFALLFKTTASNSEAVLLARVHELGLDEIIPGPQAKGWLDQGVMAFCTNNVPTQPSDDLLMDQFIKPLIGDDLVKVPLHRRLWFASCYATMAEIKQGRSQNLN